jgi:hypothetical protein
MSPARCDALYRESSSLRGIDDIMTMNTMPVERRKT